MNDNVWSKTILSVYPYLERICGAIDKMVETKAMASFYVTSQSFASSSILNVADKLIELGERKKTLINLKVLVDKALKKSEPLYAQLLIEKYIDRDNPNDIAERHSLPMRSYFRKLSSAESNFTWQMSRLGYSEQKLDEMLKNEKWIGQVYSRNLEKESKPQPAKKIIENEVALQM